MKYIIRKSILFCALVVSNTWAMKEEKPELRSVRVNVCRADKTWLEFTCRIGMIVSEKENINEKLLSYFGIDPETNIAPEERSYELTKNSEAYYTLALLEQKYDHLSIINGNLIRELVRDLHVEKRSSDEINRLLASRAGWTNTTFGKHSLENAIRRFFDEDMQSCEMNSALLALDDITRVIQDSDHITSDNKKVWQEIIDAADIFFKDRISFNLLNEKLLAQGADEAEEFGSTSWVIRQVDLQGMQFLTYALNHMHADSEKKSRIIGSWFKDKIESLNSEQLKLITERVQLWLGHYKQVETHLADMCAQKQEIAASMMRNALLKKAGLGTLIIAAGFAAYQFYQYMYNTPADKQSESAQA